LQMTKRRTKTNTGVYESMPPLKESQLRVMPVWIPLVFTAAIGRHDRPIHKWR
jgi:hypothetical protein